MIRLAEIQQFVHQPSRDRFERARAGVRGSRARESPRYEATRYIDNDNDNPLCNTQTPCTKKVTPAYHAYRVRIVAAQKEAHPHGGGRPHGKVRLGDRDGCNVDTGSHMLDKHSADPPAANTRRWSPPPTQAS